MQGFFTKQQTQSKSRPDGRVVSCVSCGLYRFVLNPRMEPFGKFKKGILNIGEAPGETEDRRGKQWQGKVGRVLQRTYRKFGIDLFEDCLNINSINCRPTLIGRNRKPTNDEIACCRKRVMKVIDQYKPKVIILLGNSALTSLIGYRWMESLGGITKWRGWTIPDRDFNTWICPTFHPSYIDREKRNNAVRIIWQQDLDRAFGMLNTPFPKYEDESKQVEVIDDLKSLRKLKSDLTAIDYETTGLKPHAKGHRIICASIATGPNHAYTFIMPKTRKERQIWINILADERIGKIAHNMKFEEMWSQVRLKQSVINWQWDGMLAAHVLDNRSGITGLKFQVYVNFGVIDYASEIRSYLKSKESKNGNAFNRIMELLGKPDGKKQLLTYNGMDSIFEFKLARLQMDKLIF